MPRDAVLPLLATVISAEFALALGRRWWLSRRPYLRSWALSLGLFAAGCAALFYGTAFGWSGATFRTFYICGALLSVPWLAMGEIELLVRPAVARIVLFFVVLFSANAAFVLAVIPFVDGAPAFGFSLPHGRDYFPAGARYGLVVATNAVGTLTVVGGTLWSGWRSRGGGPAARARFRGTLLIVLGVLVAAASGALTFLGEVGSVAATLGLGAAIMYAGFVVASRRPGAHRSARRQRIADERAETLAPGERVGPDASPEGAAKPDEAAEPTGPGSTRAAAGSRAGG
ncbi:MAG TPA: hypothetical protein VNB94_06700 [Mycobacteriales bacterium]|nr:hypothetical protein [Mycobacteriales bacterium]